MTVWKECKSKSLTPILKLFLDLRLSRHNYTLVENVIHTSNDLSLAWIHRQIEFSLLVLFIFSLLSHSFHLVSRFYHFLFILIIGVPLNHYRYQSSSIHRHRHRYSSSPSKSPSLVFLFIFGLLFQPLFILPLNSLVKCLQGEQNINQKSHFLCAIVKFA